MNETIALNACELANEVDNNVSINQIKSGSNKAKSGSNAASEICKNSIKSGSKSGSNKAKSGSKSGSNVPEKNLIGFKIEKSEPLLNPILNPIFSTEKVDNSDNLKKYLMKLHGTKKEIIKFIFRAINHTGINETFWVTRNLLSEYLNIPENTIKTSIRRLLKENIIHAKVQYGRNGNSMYKLNELIYDEVIKLIKENDIQLLEMPKEQAKKFDLICSSRLGIIININNLILGHSQNAQENDKEREFEICEIDKHNFEILEKHGIPKNMILNSLRKNKSWLVSSEIFYTQVEKMEAYLTQKPFERDRASVSSLYSFFLSCLGAAFAGLKTKLDEKGVKTKSEIERERTLREIESREQELKKLEHEYTNLIFQDWLKNYSREELNKIYPGNKLERSDEKIYLTGLESFFRTHFFKNYAQVYLKNLENESPIVKIDKLTRNNKQDSDLKSIGKH